MNVNIFINKNMHPQRSRYMNSSGSNVNYGNHHYFYLLSVSLVGIAAGVAIGTRSRQPQLQISARITGHDLKAKLKFRGILLS